MDPKTRIRRRTDQRSKVLQNSLWIRCSKLSLSASTEAVAMQRELFAGFSHPGFQQRLGQCLERGIRDKRLDDLENLHSKESKSQQRE